MSPGKLTYPPKPADKPDEPAGARKTALEVAAGVLVTDASGPEPVVAGHGDVEAIRFEDAEADAYKHLLSRPELFHGTTEQRNIARYRLLKEGGQAPAETAPAATPGGPPSESEQEQESGLSPLAQRLAEDPATEAKLRNAISELDQKAIDQAAIEDFYSSEDEVDSWEWPEEIDQGEGGEA